MKLNEPQRNFRIVGPDETASNRLGAVFEVTERAWMAERLNEDDHLAADGRVMEILSEHTCQGWLEGFIDHVVNKKADIIRVYLPPDANTLLYITDKCLRSRDFINVIVAGKQPALQWLDMAGGGIFTILGISVSMVGVFTPLVIVLGGVLASLANYSYIKLGVYYQDQGALLATSSAMSGTVFGASRKMAVIGSVEARVSSTPLQLRVNRR